MDFFTDIKKRVSDTAKSVKQRTQDSVGISRLNGQMRSLEEKKNELYKSLGKAAYALCKENGDQESIDKVIGEIDAVFEEQSSLQTQIDALSQQKRCPVCGGMAPLEAAFCPYCGRKLPEISKPEPEPEAETEEEGPITTCPSCGAERKGDEKFCMVCGAAFEADEAELEELADEVEEEIEEIIEDEIEDEIEEEIEDAVEEAIEEETEYVAGEEDDE